MCAINVYMKFQKIFNQLDVSASSESEDLVFNTKTIDSHNGGDTTDVSRSNIEQGEKSIRSDAFSLDVPEGSVANAPSANRPAVFTSLRQQVGKTIPNITNKLNRVLTVAEENIFPKSEEVS